MPSTVSKKSSAKVAIEDLGLSVFEKNNPHAELEIGGDELIVANPYGTDSVLFIFNLAEKDLIKELNKIVFKPQFDAMFHLDTNTIEFFFGYLDPKGVVEKDYLDRKFEFHFKGKKLECSYKAPSPLTYELAKRVRMFSGESPADIIPQIRYFRDFQRKDKMPRYVQKYFEKREPRNFFITADANILSIDLESIARHMNFLGRHYDRRAPEIIIRKSDKEVESRKKLPKRYLGTGFPKEISAVPLDEFVLRFIETARESTPRYAFIYYYQVFEYAGFNYMDEKVRGQIRRFLKDPSLVSCSEDRVAELFSIMTDITAPEDEVRIRKTIEDSIEPKDIWPDIEHDRDFFCEAIDFDGGISLQPLIGKDTTIETWSKMWTPKLFDQIKKIRNCIVHARERRQSSGILPTRANDVRLARYLPIVSRMAEFIALRTS